MEKILVAISGASGVIYGIKLLESLQNHAEIHLIITDEAKNIIKHETDYDLDNVEKMARFVYHNENMAATISSGSFCIDSMVVLPCSIKTLSAICNSFCYNLLTRAADVMLKEKRKLILCVREMPFHEGHLKMMASLSRRGALICPPIPFFYHCPVSITDVINSVVGKVLNLLRIEHKLFETWNGIPEYLNIMKCHECMTELKNEKGL